MRALAHLRLVSAILALAAGSCRLDAQGADCPNGPGLLSPADAVYSVEGETNLRTNSVFMPNRQTFANFKVTERRDGDGYLYTFGGVPQVWQTNHFGTARRMYFLEQGNFLLFLNEPALMRRLEQMLQNSAPKALAKRRVTANCRGSLSR